MSRNDSFDQGSQWDMRPGEEPFPDSRTTIRQKREERLRQVEDQMGVQGPNERPKTGWGSQEGDTDLSDPAESRRLRQEAKERDKPTQEAYEAGVEEGKTQVTHKEVKSALKQRRQQNTDTRQTMNTVSRLNRLARMAKGKKR